MTRRLRVSVLAVALAAPTVARAQFPTTPGRTRPGQDRPAQSQKLDEALRKVNGDDRAARLEGLDGLGGLPDEAKAVQALLESVTDADVAVSVKAIDVLGQMKNKDTTPLLVQQLFLRDTPTDVKRHVLASLGKIGDPRATPSLVDLVGRAADPNLRGGAIFALGEIGDHAALPTLEKLAKDPAADPTLRRLAEEAAKKIKDQPPPPTQPSALEADRRGGRQPISP